MPTSVTGLGVVYGSFQFSNMAGALAEINSANSVVTGMDIQPSYNSFAASWATSSLPGTFSGSLHYSLLPAFQVAANQEAAQGHVITAVSYSSGQIAYFSYGWSNDSGTAYEASVTTTTKAMAATSAGQLAAGGYIITAIGGNDQDGVILVGTRVKGDSLARPFLAVPGGQSPLALSQGGYATVGVIYSGNAGFISWIGEK